MRPHRANDAVPRLVETLFLCGALFLPGCSGRVVSPDSYVAAEAGTIDAAALRARTTPALVIRALASSFNRRDPQRYAELFTGDYQFVFAAYDSAGNAFRASGFLREDELRFAQHLFVTGTGGLPPADRISMTLSDAVSQPDPRPGKDPSVHRVIRAEFLLSIETPGPSWRISGASRFYLVRGDSAQIPPDLLLRGFRPDASRWWIERWEDESLGAPATTNALPARPITLGMLKLLYH